MKFEYLNEKALIYLQKENNFAKKPFIYKITQGLEITQAKFEKITQPTGGFGHSQPPKFCRKKKPGLASSQTFYL